MNDTCIIEANVAVFMVEIKISQDPKTGSSIPRPVEYSNQGHKEQGPPLDMGSMNVPGPYSAACKGTLFKTQQVLNKLALRFLIVVPSLL